MSCYMLVSQCHKPSIWGWNPTHSMVILEMGYCWVYHINMSYIYLYHMFISWIWLPFLRGFLGFHQAMVFTDQVAIPPILWTVKEECFGPCHRQHLCDERWWTITSSCGICACRQQVLVPKTPGDPRMWRRNEQNSLVLFQVSEQITKAWNAKS